MLAQFSYIFFSNFLFFSFLPVQIEKQVLELQWQESYIEYPVKYSRTGDFNGDL